MIGNFHRCLSARPEVGHFRGGVSFICAPYGSCDDGRVADGTPIGRTGAGASMLIALCTVLALRGWDLSLTSFRSVEVGALAVVDFGRFHHRFGERRVRMDR